MQTMMVLAIYLSFFSCILALDTVQLHSNIFHFQRSFKSSIGFLDPAFLDKGGFLDGQVVQGGKQSLDGLFQTTEGGDGSANNDTDLVVLDDGDFVVNETESLLNETETETGNTTVSNPGNNTFVNANATSENTTSTASMVNTTLAPTNTSETNETSSSDGNNDTSVVEPMLPTNGTDSQMPTTAVPESTTIVTINSSFIVSTKHAQWTNSSSLELVAEVPEGDIDGLVEAFSDLASLVVTGINANIIASNDNITVRRYYLRRQLQSSALITPIGYNAATATIISLRPNASCSSQTPPSAGSLLCFLTAYGQYNVTVQDGGDLNFVYDMAVRDTQAAIEQGVLQEELERVDPTSIFTVEAASEPLSLPPPTTTMYPSPSPETTVNSTSPPETPAEGDGGGGMDTVVLILIIAISVTALFLCILFAIYVWLKRNTPPPDLQEKNTKSTNEKDNENSYKDPRNPEEPLMESYPHQDGDHGQSGSDWPSSSNLEAEADHESESSERLQKYRQRVADLVEAKCPEELPNVDRIIEQFKDREPALIAMLQNMDAVEQELEENQAKTAGSEDGDYIQDDPMPRAAVSCEWADDTGAEEKEEIEPDSKQMMSDNSDEFVKDERFVFPVTKTDVTDDLDGRQDVEGTDENKSQADGLGQEALDEGMAHKEACMEQATTLDLLVTIDGNDDVQSERDEEERMPDSLDRSLRSSINPCETKTSAIDRLEAVARDMNFDPNFSSSEVHGDDAYGFSADLEINIDGLHKELANADYLAKTPEALERRLQRSSHDGLIAAPETVDSMKLADGSEMADPDVTTKEPAVNPGLSAAQGL
jgi:hypothetical protein